MKCTIMMNTEHSLNIYDRREMCSGFNENACGIHVTDENWRKTVFFVVIGKIYERRIFFGEYFCKLDE